MYTDNSLEFGKACEDLSWTHCTSTPHRSETDGIAERAVRRVKEGTSAVLLQSGLGYEWWADSMECYCCLRNIQDLLSDGKTPYERRYGVLFNGPVIPFGAMVEYHPISAEDFSRLHQFGPPVLPCIFLGYALHAGGIWKGNIMVANIEELEMMDASEIHAKKLNAKGVLTPKKGGNLIFTVADGTVKILIHLNPGASGRGGNQTDLLPPHIETHRGMMVMLGMISGPCQETLFTVITWNPESNCTCRSEESFPIPLKYIGVTRTTDTSLDVMLEENIDDYWNVDGYRALSDTWSGFTRFTVVNETPPVGFSSSRGRLRCQPQCLAKFNVRSSGKAAVLQRIARQNTLALLRPKNLRGSA